jgi:hypothetical protein
MLVKCINKYLHTKNYSTVVRNQGVPALYLGDTHELNMEQK